MDPAFAQAWQQAHDERLDELEAMQYEDAKIRPEDRRFVLRTQRPDVWGDKKLVGHVGKIEVNHHVQELTDAQLKQIIAGDAEVVE
jgi:hypothetical protein